jgi:hypothetical protein
MALEFLNDARSYDASRQCVSFWGHDFAFEVTFRLDHTALSSFTGQEPLSEPTALKAFDANLARIRKAARKLYRAGSKRYLEISVKDM